jgi:peptidoglycan hydrolase-like protein with peptidoglycan-binding domain
VVALKRFLVTQGVLSSQFVTTYFGTSTEAAVQEFQCKQKLVCSGGPASTGWGKVGPKTRAAIRAISCGVAPPIVTVQPAAPSCRLSVDNPLMYAGEAVTLSWTSKGVVGGTITPLVGEVGAAGSKKLSNITQSTPFSGVFTGSSASGMVAVTCTTSVMVVKPATDPTSPSISSFSASPIVVTAGQPITLTWEVLRAAQITITGLGVVSGSSIQVTPATTTTYTLTATNMQGTVFKSITVIVNGVATSTCSTNCAVLGQLGLTVTPLSGQAPFVATFTATLPDDAFFGSSYKLTFGDGTSQDVPCSPNSAATGCNARTITHTYSSAGTYLASLGGFPSLNIATVNVSVIDTSGGGGGGSGGATLTASPASGAAPLSTSIVVTLPYGSTVGTYTIKYGDGTSETFDCGTGAWYVSTSCAQTFTFQHMYGLPGTYKVEVGNKSMMVTVSGGQSGISMRVNPTSGNVPLSATFSITLPVGSSIGKYTLDYGDGTSETFLCGISPDNLYVSTSCGQTFTFTHMYGLVGTFTAKLGNISIPVTINGTPNPATLVASPTAGAAPLGVHFTVTLPLGSAIGSYTLTYGDGTNESFLCGISPDQDNGYVSTACAQTFNFQHMYGLAGTYKAEMGNKSVTITPQ